MKNRKSYKAYYPITRRVNMLCALFGVLLLILPATTEAAKTYQNPADFVNEQFSGQAPAAKVQSLTASLQSRLSNINGNPYRSSRVRYWQKGTRTVYILDDIGKTQPITIGYVIDGEKLSNVKVLIYRESHGDDVSRTYFTKQFKSVSLKNNKLSKKPKNIAGATMSVRTLTRMARAALFLKSQL